MTPPDSPPDDRDDADDEAAFETARESLADLEAQIQKHDIDSLESLDSLDAETLDAVVGNLDALERAGEALSELLETIDIDDVHDAIDGDAVGEAIDLGTIPELLREESEIGSVVDVNELISAIELLEAWDASELADLWEGTRELSASVDDLAKADDSLVGTAASKVSDNDEFDAGDLIDGVGRETDFAVDDIDATEVLGIEEIDVLEDPELYQTTIQQGAMKGIDGVREALVIAHEKFEALYEYNRERMRRTDRRTNSRNPTAVSTMPIDRTRGGARYSTVPQQVKLSTAPSRRRIYGRRFEDERERRTSGTNGGDASGR